MLVVSEYMYCVKYQFFMTNLNQHLEPGGNYFVEWEGVGSSQQGILYVLDIH